MLAFQVVIFEAWLHERTASHERRCLLRSVRCAPVEPRLTAPVRADAV
jgi:hypothetical protein